MEGSHSSDKERRQAAEELKKVERLERSALARLTQVVKLQDFMTVLMVAATAFSALATWRVAQLTSAWFGVSQRPYMGVAAIRIDTSDDHQPKVIIEYRNFGNIPAADLKASGRILLDGKTVGESASDPHAMNIGVSSPQVPHFLHRELPPTSRDAILAGRARLEVNVAFNYRNGKGPYCYEMKFLYDPYLRNFDPAGGTDHCR